MAIRWWLAEHTRDRGDECTCPDCAADHLHLTTLDAAVELARERAQRPTSPREARATEAEHRRLLVYRRQRLGLRRAAARR